MEAENKMKLVCEFPVGTLRTMTTVNNVAQLATALKNVPGVGKPFLVFASLSGPALMADFDLHLDWAGSGNKVVSDVNTNIDMINAMLATPPTDAVTL
jgi:hypothetical protein